MFVGQNKSYETYKEELVMWSRTTSLEEKIEVEFIVYSLDGHSSDIKEKIQDKIRDKLEIN